MRPSRIRVAVAVVGLVGAVSIGTALASGSVRPPSASGGTESPFRSTAYMRCTVVEVHDEQRLVVRDRGAERPHVITIPEGIGIRAKDKAAFGGRKRLTFADFAPGQELRVAVDVETGRVLQVRVLS